MSWFQGFEAQRFAVDGAELFARLGGPPDAPPLLLLHGFPQTHALWHRVAQALRPDFRLVVPDLRGYGDSSRPLDDAGHLGHSKRAMAADLAALMTQLGHERFGVVGHDRGGRVAHRLALDHPQRVSRLCVLDIAPTLDMYEATDLRFATAYHHWFHLIQPAPLPERMIGGDPLFYLHWTLGG
jgi:haloacetate dehalogenase